MADGEGGGGVPPTPAVGASVRVVPVYTPRYHVVAVRDRPGEPATLRLVDKEGLSDDVGRGVGGGVRLRRHPTVAPVQIPLVVVAREDAEGGSTSRAPIPSPPMSEDHGFSQSMLSQPHRVFLFPLETRA